MEKQRNIDTDKQMVDLLFNEKDYEKLRQMMGDMWQLRKDLLRPS